MANTMLSHQTAYFVQYLQFCNVSRLSKNPSTQKLMGFEVPHAPVTLHQINFNLVIPEVHFIYILR